MKQEPSQNDLADVVVRHKSVKSWFNFEPAGIARLGLLGLCSPVDSE
jgi:hypothetical protein